jgi:hypothetical protein
VNEIGRCRDCKWWGSERRSDWGQCSAAAMDGGKPAHHPETRMLAQDAYDYEAWLVTAPDFGCVQFEAKE